MTFTSFSPTMQYANFSTLAYETRTATAVTVTTGTTPVTTTAAQILTGFLIVDCQDTGTITLPTAALLAAAIEGCFVGCSFVVYIRNSGDSVLTVAAGTGGTVSGTATIANAVSKGLLFIFTNVTPGTEAYTAYSLGSATT